MIKKFLDNLITDFQTASDNHEQYMRMQSFYKGKNAKPMSVSEFMTFDYLPKPLRTFLLRMH